MKRISQFLFFAAIITMGGTAVTWVYAQSAASRTLMAYKEGVTPEDENADRMACHEWAVTQSGFDPAFSYAAQRAWITSSNTLPADDRRYPANTGIAGTRGTSDVARLNQLYETYLTAGQVCLEGRGYTVSR
jgi:hypothetical protein